MRIGTSIHIADIDGASGSYLHDLTSVLGDELNDILFTSFENNVVGAFFNSGQKA